MRDWIVTLALAACAGCGSAKAHVSVRTGPAPTPVVENLPEPPKPEPPKPEPPKPGPEETAVAASPTPVPDTTLAMAKACDAGDLPRCAELAFAYSQGEGVAKDGKHARDLY